MLSAPTLLNHLHRLPAGVDQVVFIAVHRLNAEQDAARFGMFCRRRQRAGDVVVFLLRWRHAGAFADAAIGDAGKREAAHFGGLVDGDFQMLDGAFRIDGGPVLLRQAERADGLQVVLFQKRAANARASTAGALSSAISMKSIL